MLRRSIFGVFCGIFIARFDVFFAQNQCIPRTPLNVTLEDIAGKWFVIAYVNETNPVEREQRCIQQPYRYNPDQDAIDESRTSTWTTTGQTVITYRFFKFAAPGLINDTTDINNIITNYLNVILEVTRGKSIIFSNCVTINGSLYTDRLVLFMNRQHVSDRTIRKKFAAIGVQLNDVNVLYRVPQNNCSYGV